MLNGIAGQIADVFHGQHISIHQVFYKKDIAHLLAIAIQVIGLFFNACIRKCATQPWSSVPNWCGP
jgi:hypothetical protein